MYYFFCFKKQSTIVYAQSMLMKKYTKIIATLGPSLNDAQILEKTILEGVDVCRLNLSHGSLSFHAQTIRDKASQFSSENVLKQLNQLYERFTK